MKTIKTGIILKNFKQEVLKNGENNLTIGEALANILSGKTSNPTLAWVLGKKFATDKEVDLKAEEIVFLKKELESNETYYSVVTGQIIEILETNEKKDATI